LGEGGANRNTHLLQANNKAATRYLSNVELKLGLQTALKKGRCLLQVALVQFNIEAVHIHHICHQSNSTLAHRPSPAFDFLIQSWII
jgi:hypothetical protein